MTLKMSTHDMMSDPFRDTWVRYLGYSNEVGEAFRPVVPVSWVRYSYTLAASYVLADTLDKSYKMYQKDARTNKVMIATGDALLWQSLASIIIPGITINRISHFTLRGLNSFGPSNRAFTPRAQCFIAVFVGLASIPLIIGPIDHGVDMFMNGTYRKVFK